MVSNPHPHQPSVRPWVKILDQIKNQVSAANFRTWFLPTVAELSSDNTLTIHTPSAFNKNQLIEKHGSLIGQVVEEVFSEKMAIVFKVSPAKFSVQSEETQPIITSLETPSLHRSSPYNTGLNPRYTLRNFMVGLSNNLAFAAAQAVVQNPGTSYNPLFIYGGTGVGKTHLMQAISHAMLENNPTLKILYCSSEKFTNDFVESIQTKQTSPFRAKYRSCDALLVDDIQFISGRDSTQEEFFHTYNDLHAKNKQLVLTSDRPPQEIQKMEARLASRFQGGLMVDIQPPDFDTRVAILKARCSERGVQIDAECLALIAQQQVGNARELEGKLIQIIQLSQLKGELITPEFLKNYQNPHPYSLTKADQKRVLSGIQQYFNIKMSELTGPRRKRELVIPRQITMYLLYEECHIPYESIGRILGGRDHTTILHGVEKIRQEIQRDRETQRIIMEVKQALI